MKDKAKSLMDNCLEIEGLLSLLIQRGDKVPEHLYSLLEAKSARLHEEISLLHPEEEQMEEIKEMEEVADSAEFEETADADEQPDDTPDAVVEEVNEVEAETPIYKMPELPVLPPELPELPMVEETPVRNDSLKSAEFSLNDKFRFRRELFNYSDEEMTEALRVADEMTSAADVEDYFYNDLCWDPNNADVKDFISIVTARFK